MTTQPTTVNKEEMPDRIWAGKGTGDIPAHWSVYKEWCWQVCHVMDEYVRSDIHQQTLEALKLAEKNLIATRQLLSRYLEPVYGVDYAKKVVVYIDSTQALQTLNSIGR